MSREIKFRCWSNLQKRWCENFLLLACIDGLPFAHFVEVDENKKFKAHHVYNASNLDLEIQQYTGLKDKNGKEIYEGDIIKYEHPTDEQVSQQDNRNSRNLVEVRWTKEDEDNHPGFRIRDLWGQCGSIEVVGNIFETPNLISNCGKKETELDIRKQLWDNLANDRDIFKEEDLAYLEIVEKVIKEKYNGNPTP